MGSNFNFRQFLFIFGKVQSSFCFNKNVVKNRLFEPTPIDVPSSIDLPSMITSLMNFPFLVNVLKLLLFSAFFEQFKSNLKFANLNFCNSLES